MDKKHDFKVGDCVVHQTCSYHLGHDNHRTTKEGMKTHVTAVSTGPFFHPDLSRFGAIRVFSESYSTEDDEWSTACCFRKLDPATDLPAMTKSSVPEVQS